MKTRRNFPTRELRASSVHYDGDASVRYDGDAWERYDGDAWVRYVGDASILTTPNCGQNDVCNSSSCLTSYLIVSYVSAVVLCTPDKTN